MKIIIKLALTATVLLTILWNFDFAAAVRLLSTVSIATIIGCLLLVLFQAWVASVRLSKMVSLFGHRLDLATSYRFTLQSMFFNQAFTSFLGGDAWRIWRIHRTQVSLTDAASAVALDRVIGFVVNHLAFVALLPWLLGAIENTAVKWALIALAAGGLAGFAVLLVLGFLRGRLTVIDRLPPRLRTSRVAGLVIEIATVGRHVLADLRGTLAIGVISLPIVLINGLVFFIILRNWDTAPLLALGCALLVPAIMEIALLPVSIAGWGMREGAAILGFGALGLNSELALAASVAFGLFGLAVGLLGGIVLQFDRRWRADMPPVTGDETRPSSLPSSE